MVGAGTGIAPLFQLIRHVLEDEEDHTTVHLGTLSNALILTH